MAAKQNCGRVCKTFRLIKSVVTIPEIRNLYVTLYKFSTRQRTVNLSFFIARRMAQPAPGNKPGVMERIAVVSVALGMAVMILAMAVIMGFKREVARKMTGFAAHVAVTDIRGVNALDAQPVRRSAHVEELIRRTDGFVAMAPYAVKGGIVRTADAVGEVMLKGVEADYDWSYFREWLVAGELPRVGGEVRTKDILLSRTLADKLLLGVGDKVEMLFVEPGEMPRRDRFKVAGVYESGMEEMDGVVVVTHDTSLKRCTGKNAKVYDLTFAEIEALDAGRWFSARFAGTRIPSFEEVLQLCQSRIDLNVEIKPSAATPTLEAETVRLLRAYGFEGHCVITSQSYETLHKVKELAPDIPTGYILALGVGNYYDLPDADFFSVEHTFITSGMVNQIHLRGKTISAWTIAQEDDARHMMELGADDLITDKPDLVHELLRQNAEMDTTLLSLRDAIQGWFFPAPDEEVSDEAEDVIEDVIEDPEEFLDAA